MATNGHQARGRGGPLRVLLPLIYGHQLHTDIMQRGLSAVTHLSSNPSPLNDAWPHRHSAQAACSNNLTIFDYLTVHGGVMPPCRWLASSSCMLDSFGLCVMCMRHLYCTARQFFTARGVLGDALMHDLLMLMNRYQVDDNFACNTA